MSTKQKGNNMMDNFEDNRFMVGAAIAAIAAGAYFFMGPDGKKHQKKMRGWMVRMKGEVLEKLEDVREVTEPVYNEIVDTVAKAELVSNKIPKSEILMLASDLKREWKTISRLIKGNKPVAKKRRTAKKGSAKRSSSKKAATKRASQAKK